MSFFDGKIRIATAQAVNARWLSGKPGEHFRCGFCGYKFCVGDKWRCLYTNDHPNAWGNPLVCENCDDTKEILIERWAEMHNQAKTKYWWFTKR